MVALQTGRWSYWVTLCIASFAGGVADASAVNEDSEAGNPDYWAIQLENDFFAGTGDRYYTHGTQLSRMLIHEPPQWLQTIGDIFPAFESDGMLKAVNYTLGQKIFTPNDTEAIALAVNDRPYAGYLYVSAALLSRVSSINNVDTGNVLEITLGVVGPASLAENTQTQYHELIGIDVPKGWDNQLANEPVIGMSYARFWRHITPISNTLQYGMTPHVSVALGNAYTYVASGVMMRVGSRLSSDLAPPNISPGFPGLSLFKPSQQNSWYLFAGAEGRAVARNIFLDGNTFSDSHSVDKKQLVGDLQFGVVFQTGNMRFSISNMIRTKEYDGQKDKTHFGAINISFSV